MRVVKFAHFIIKSLTIMSQLTGFVPADNTANAAGAFTISRGTSPFQQGVVFNVTGFGFVQAEIDGKVAKDARTIPVLKTTIGDLFLSMVTRQKLDADNNILKPSGTANKKIAEIIRENLNKNDGEILTAIVNELNNCPIVVSRKPYAALSKDGRRFAAELIELNFK